MVQQLFWRLLARSLDRSRFAFMNSLPNTRSAASWLCARHRRRMFSTLAVPPRATGVM
jgi:hypothetical protein